MTKIAWTDETWNPVVGCSKCSPGCDHCYAERMAGRLCYALSRTAGDDGVSTWAGYSSIIYYDGVNGKPSWNGKTEFIYSALEKPFHWKKPRKIFVCSMGDLFHESVPFEWIDDIMAVIAMCPQHTFQVLTKRPRRMNDYFTTKNRSCPPHAMELFDEWTTEECVFSFANTSKDFDYKNFVWPLKNLWLGVTAENQAMAGERIPILLDTPAVKRFVSIEPMLEKIDLNHVKWAKINTDNWNLPHGVPNPSECWSTNNVLSSRPADELNPAKIGLDWVIVGCESGTGRRECKLEWMQSVVDQCKMAGVPVLVKQIALDGNVVGWDKSTLWPKGLQMMQWPVGW